jgi:hypothetical protein
MTILDALLLLADQARKAKGQLRADAALNAFGTHADDDPCPNQARRHGIGIAEHGNRREARDADPHLAARRKRGLWQRSEGGQVLFEARLGGLVALFDQLSNKAFIAGAIAKIAAAPVRARLDPAPL